MAGRKLSGWTILCIALVAVAALAFYGARTSRRAYGRFIDRAIELDLGQRRPARGGLLDVPYAPLNRDRPRIESLAEARGLIGQFPESTTTDRWRAYMALLDQNWGDAVGGLESLARSTPTDAKLVNDLGVVYMEQAASNPILLVSAYSQFEAASVLQPGSPQPWFNLALTLNLLGLDQAVAAVRQEVTNAEASAPWALELEALLQSSHGDEDGIMQILIDTARADGDALVQRYARRLDPGGQDRTVQAILDPLLGPNRAEIRRFRLLLLSSMDAFRAADREAGDDLLESARSLLAHVDSDFDRLLFRLHEAESSPWTGDRNLPGLANAFESIILEAQGESFYWLSARAITSRASDRRLATSRFEIIADLAQAVGWYDHANLSLDSVRTRLYLAHYLLLEGNYADSFRYAYEGLSLTPRSEHLVRSRLYWVLTGNPHITNDNLRMALANHAATEARLSTDSIETINSHVRIAELLAERGDFDAALDYLGTAESAVDAMPEGEFAAPRYVGELPFMLGKAGVLRMQGKTRESENVLRSALKQIVTEGIPDYEYQFRLQLAKLLGATGRVVDARKQFEAAIAAVEREDSELGDAARLSFDEPRRAVYESVISFEVAQDQDELAWDYFQRYRSKLWDESLVQLGSTSAALPSSPARLSQTSQDAIVEFGLLDSQLLRWVTVGTSRHLVATAMDRQQVQASVEAFLDLIESQADPLEVSERARSLYSTLFLPIEDLLTNVQTIVIVPDRALHRLPFAALQNRDGLFLVERFESVETPTVSFFETVSVPSVEPSKLAAFGSPASNDDRWMRQELRAVQAIYGEPIQVFDGFEVTPDLILDEMEGSSFIIYVGHGHEGGSSLSARLALNPTDPDQDVSALEIAGRRTAPNALVVLSSCDSSVGNFIGGVEFRGLTSAFLAAGAGSVVGSLWPVPSKQTYDLMTRFHRAVADGESIARALQTAQLGMISEGLPPYYWAGFTVTGNRTALDPAPFADSAALMAAAPLSR